MSFPRYPKYKASGVEWLGDVPAHWEVRRFQRCVFVAEGQVDPEDARYSGMTLIAPNHVQSGTGRLLCTEAAAEQGAESGKYLCRAGDVVYSKIRPALRKACIAPEDCLCSADMYALRAHSGLTNEFLLWVILSEQFSSLVVLESQRVAMPKVNRESLKDVAIPLPPENEQKVVVAFLDRETAKIDALVAEQQRLIELLKEKRQAVISHAVTKGLDPTAKLKPSGIEWLGDVPANWSIGQSRRYFSHRNERAREGDRQLTASQVHGVVFQEDFVRLEGRRVVEVIKGADILKHVEPGDFVISMRSFEGGIERCELRGCISSAYVMLEPRPSIHGPYFGYVLKSRSYIQALQATTNLVRDGQALRYNNFAQVAIPVVPMHEQIAIAAFLREETERIDSLLSKQQAMESLLQERRAALISAAVTGQIDVSRKQP